MALQSQDVTRRSASTTASPQVREPLEVAKLIDLSKCIGCKACQVACMEWNDIRDGVGTNVGVYDNPADLSDRSWTVMRFYEEELPDKGLQFLMVKDGCLHCQDPGCLRACPAPGAIVQYANGIVDVDATKCIGCGYCATGCPFDVPKFQKTTGKMAKCTLCVDRVEVGLEPACIKACPTGCLQFGTKDNMVALANNRVAQLKANGFEDAMVYDPPGVNGTGVVTVLGHGHPEWYGLPADPHVPWGVRLWKQVVRPLGVLAAFVTVLGVFVHYGRFGPKEPTE